MPATPSPRALFARALMLVRATSGGASSGPNRARLRTRLGSRAARCVATIVPSEWASTCARSTSRLDRTLRQACRKRSIDNGPSTRCDRPEPGRSKRTAVKRESAGSSGVKVFDVPPSPWMQSAASPPPVGLSISTAMRSTRWNSLGMVPLRHRSRHGAARRAYVGLLVEAALLHHGEDAVPVLQERDVGQRIAIDQQQVRQTALLHQAELTRLHHDFAAEPGGGDDRLHGREAEIFHEVFEIGGVAAVGDPGEAVVAAGQDLDPALV